MIKVFLLLVSLAGNIFAEENYPAERNKSNKSTIFIETKTLLEPSGIIRARAIFHNIKVTNEMAESLQVEPYFVTHITAKIGKYIAYDLSMSDTLSRRQYIQFYFHDIPNISRIEYIVTDNRGYIAHHFSEIIRKQETAQSNQEAHFLDTQITDYRNTKPEAWKETSINTAIEALYGKQEAVLFKHITKCQGFPCVDSIQCLGGIPCVNGVGGFGIGINLLADNELESIAVFSTTAGENVTKAVMSLPIMNQNKYYLPEIEVKKDGVIVLVAKGRDGKLYKSEAVTVKAVLSMEEGDTLLFNFNKTK